MPIEEMNEEQKQIWTQHPKRSIDLIKSKKIIIPPKVEKMILQHHEKFNGTGFPKSLMGDMIDISSQLLSFADQFHHLSVIEEGKKKLKPKEIFEKIAENGSVGLELLNKLRHLFESQENQPSDEKTEESAA